MYQITKRFDFCASHQLIGLPETHQCARLHGHNYQITVALTSEEPDEIGFVRDYGSLSLIKDYIDNTLEHRHLNEIFNFNPTAENMAKYFHDLFKVWYPEVMSVQVKETEKTSSTYIGMPDFRTLLEELADAGKNLKEMFGEAEKSLNSIKNA